MSKKIRTEAVDYLFNAILSLENKEECYTFFEDICTINELLSLSQRFEVARMLREQKTYLEIAEKTGASTATISRVNRSLNYGNDGYDMVFERIGLTEKEEDSSTAEEQKVERQFGKKYERIFGRGSSDAEYKRHEPVAATIGTCLFLNISPSYSQKKELRYHQ